jgi:carboxypeptidase C (cathepsin A)
MQKQLGLLLLVILLVFGQTALITAQKSQKVSKETPKEAAVESPAPKEESSVTEHTIQLGGQTIAYKATAGTVLLKDDKDKPTASMFYVAYTRNDVKDFSQRPIAFLYNGGPGSSAVWLHMGAFGPVRVVTANAQPTAPAPYQVVSNTDCLLDKTDLVFIDPVGTGFSHAVGKSKDQDFWGIDQDVKSIAQFITTYVSRNDRWNSPKFLIGESYGTFRSAALGNNLQASGMDLNGIVLLSNVLDMSTLSFKLGDDMPYIYYLPSYAAVAWYHKVLKNRPANLPEFLTQARKFAGTEYADALIKGSSLSPEESADVLKKLSYFTGLSEDYLSRAHLRVKLGQFMEELQRSRGLTTGRLDARFSGPTFDLLGENAAYDPQETAITGAFTAAFNHYIRQVLKFGGDKKYVIMSGKANEKWVWKRKEGSNDFGSAGAASVMEDLKSALISNPHLQVQVENGYFDLATPFFATEHTMDHLGLPQDLESHIHFEYYEAGHMMYLRQDSLAKLKANIAAFITSASKK